MFLLPQVLQRQFDLFFQTEFLAGGQRIHGPGGFLHGVSQRDQRGHYVDVFLGSTTGG